MSVLNTFLRTPSYTDSIQLLLLTVTYVINTGDRGRRKDLKYKKLKFYILNQ